jgi:Sulfatase/Sigma-70 region 2
VIHPDFVAVSPGQVLVICKDQSVTRIDPLHIVAIEEAAPKKRPNLKVFAKAYTRRHTYEPTGKLSTWLWRVAMNTCYDELRRPYRRRESTLEPDDSASDQHADPETWAAPGLAPDRAAAERDQSYIGLGFCREDWLVQIAGVEIIRRLIGYAQLPLTNSGALRAELLLDDLGYSDVGVHGGKEIPTPHINSIATSGVRFSYGYVSGPYCSPTRAALLTGRYQQRFGHEFNPPGFGPGTNSWANASNAVPAGL